MELFIFSTSWVVHTVEPGLNDFLPLIKHDVYMHRNCADFMMCVHMILLITLSGTSSGLQ